MFRPSISFLAVFAILLSALPLVSGVHTRVEDAKIMAEKSMEEGVVVTPSGLLYKELRPGKRALCVSFFVLFQICSSHFNRKICIRLPLQTEDGMKPGHFEPCTMRWHNGTLIDRVTKPHHQDTPDNIIIRRRPSELIPGWAEALQRSEPVFSLIQQKEEDKILYHSGYFTFFLKLRGVINNITFVFFTFPPSTEQRKVQWSRFMFRHFWDTVI